MGGSERRRGRERPGGWGEDSGPRPIDATEPRSPAGGGSERESAKEGASREDQLLGAQITASPHPTPQTQPVPPRARLRNLAPAPTTIVPAHLTPLPGSRRGQRLGRRPPGEPETRLGEGSGRELGRRWVPQHLRARGAAGRKGRRDCGRADPGWEKAGRGEMRRQRHSATQEILRRETKGWSGGGEGERRGGGKRDPSQERSGSRLLGGRSGRKRG